MKCDWEVGSSAGSEPVNSREVLSPDEPHSAKDIQRLLTEKHELFPPADRNEKIRWPASNDKSWKEFDVRTSEKLKTRQRDKQFQEKMKIHCDVVYEEGVRWFGLLDKSRQAAASQVQPNRRQLRIESLVGERRELRKKLRKANTDIERDGYGALLKVLAEKLMSLRRAEARKKKQAQRRRTNRLFKLNPFRAVKNILCPNPAGELKCSKEELDSHLENTYGDERRSIPLGVLDGLPEKTVDPRIPFNTRDISRKEHEDVIKKARAKSAPGNNGLPYLVYKRCPGISENLWVLNRLAFKTAEYPDNCRFFEGVYIPKTDGDFGPDTGRPISLGNVQGKVYMSVLAKRLTEFVIQNDYVDTTVQKGGVPKVKGCIEHFGAMWEVIKDAKLNRKDLSVVWLDLANAYGAVPHLLIIRALRFYNIPTKVVNIILLYFSGVYGRFSSRTVTSKWQKFEIGIFMGCVISVIIFVLCMNLADEYVKIKIPKAIQYVKGVVPIPVLKLFMDDSCVTSAKAKDMEKALVIVKNFVDWARFRLKSSKSRALVFRSGKAVKWSQEDSEVEDSEEDSKIYLGGELIPNVCEKPIKFLGRWIRADAKDKVVIEQTRQDLVVFLQRLDKSDLSGLQKCWGYQYLVLPKMKWALAIYDIPLSTIFKWEQMTNKHLRSWLGAGHTLSRLCLFSKDSGVALPIDSLLDTWKVEKCRLQQSYNTSPDEFVRAICPKVRSGQVWKAEDALTNAERDLECEAVRGMVQPHLRAGIGFGEWKKPWEKLSDKEKEKAIMERVTENLNQERQTQYGTLEMQSRWVEWRDEVLALDMSWNNMFKMGDSMVGFALRAVYGTLITPALASKWNEDEDGNCKLCNLGNPGTIRHILSGCPVSLQQGRYRWRHDKVLKQIEGQVAYHVEHRVNNPRRSTKIREEDIKFVGAGCRTGGRQKNANWKDMGITNHAKDWKVMSDLGQQLKFPSEIADTRLRPDLIIYSTAIKRVIWWELTCPSEERISDSHEIKLDRYANLQVDCQSNGWSCYNLAVEVGARGFVAESLSKAARMIGIRGRALKKLTREVGEEALHCSRWIYLLAGKKEWEYRDVG